MKKFGRYCLALLFMLSGCATNSKTRWALMGTAAPVGAVVGYSTAPDDEKPAAHGFLWAAAFTAIAGVVGNYFFSDDKELDSLRAENSVLKSVPKFEMLGQDKGRFIIPGEKNSGTKPGNYKVKRIDVWVEDGPNARIHQDMRVEKEIESESKRK